MTVPSKGAEQSLMAPHSATTSYQRSPSKALVGDKEGKDPRPKPKEVQKADVEEVEVQKEEEKKEEEEPKPSTSTAGNGQALVCTCHLRKANQTSH